MQRRNRPANEKDEAQDELEEFHSSSRIRQYADQEQRSDQVESREHSGRISEVIEVIHSYEQGCEICDQDLDKWAKLF